MEGVWLRESSRTLRLSKRAIIGKEFLSPSNDFGGPFIYALVLSIYVMLFILITPPGRLSLADLTDSIAASKNVNNQHKFNDIIRLISASNIRS